MTYTYTTKMSSLREFLARVKSKELGIPRKLTMKYLESVGYKAKNDRPIIRVLKAIDFLDSNGVPTDNFKAFRTEKSDSVMASALRKAYTDLFQTYSDAQAQSTESLVDFFAGTSDLKRPTLEYMVNTFRTLCEFADFGAVPLTKAEVKETKGVLDVAKVTAQMPAGVTINLNIQLTLPATEDATVYDKIFKALKENLLS